MLPWRDPWLPSLRGAKDSRLKGSRFAGGGSVEHEVDVDDVQPLGQLAFELALALD